MDEWSERIDDLLYAGEEIEERVEFGSDDVVVTTHRILALGGERYRAVDRPNVIGATIGFDGERGHLATAGKAGIAAAALFALDAAVDLGGTLSIAAADAPAATAGSLETAARLLALMDLTLTLAWALPAVVALGYLARYAVGRRRALRIAVAGEADVVISVGEDPPVERLADAIDPETPSVSTGDPPRRS